LLLFTAATTSIAAQKTMTVEDAVAAALKNNYDILLLRNDSTAYALDNSYAKAAFLPRLNASTGLVFNNNNQKQRLSDGSTKQSKGIRSSNLSASLNLNWTLFDGLKMFATRDKLAEFVRLGELNIKTQVVNTIAAITTNYYNIVRQKQQLKAIEEQMKLTEDRVALADKKYSTGLGAKPELLQAKVDLNAQKAARLEELTLIGQLKESLNQLIAIAPGTNYEVTDSIPINNNLVMGDIIGAVDQANPSLLFAKKNIDIANITLREKKADRFPIISFNSAYNFSKTDNKTVINTFTPLFNRNAGFNYGLTASIPIFNNYNAKRQIQQAQLDIDYLKISYQNQRNKIDISIRNAFLDYEQQKKSLALEEENILLAKENVSIAAARFKQGVSTYLELRDAQKSLEDAYNRLIAARYNTKVAETELLRLKGELGK
jgi:outer membrane protein TolC